MSTLLDSEFQCWIGESGIPAANVNHTIRGQDCEPAKGAAGIAPAADGGYALSPMQSGMLYEALLHPESGYNVEQLQITLTEPLDAEVFRRAFTRVANHVPVLATAFEWEGLAKPVQRVHAGVDVPLVQLELSENAAIRTRELESFLEADRARGFDLRQPPLMRLALFGASSARPQLVWTFHHILLDGRSFPAILDLVFRTYAALRRGEPSPECSAPTRPYADFIRWLDQRDPERSAEFFRALWQGRSAPTPLPAAEPTQRPLPRHGSGRAHFQLGPSALDGLIALARDTGTSVATVVQAAWGLTLARFTGCDDVVFGSARACRRSALDGSAEDMLGLFMNTLPVRACLSAGRSVRELLLELRAQSLAMREHEHCPLTDVQRFCGLSGSAMFETMLMFEHRSLKASLCAIDRASWQPRELILHERPSLPLTAIVVQEATLDIDLLFDSTRFTVGAVERIGEAFCVGLVALARDPERRVAELDVLSAKQRKQILKDWNDTSRPFPNQLRIHQLFEARVALQPDAVALEFEGETLSYRELEAGANRLAHLLRARGAAPGRYIGVCLERGFELVVALLGVAKSGAAYVPLDPDWPRERLAFMVQAAGLDCIVTERLHAASFDVPTLELDGTDQPRLLESSPEQPAALGDATDVCYAIFTSGSTGEPKGVVLTHRAVVNTLDWVNRSFAVGANDRLLFVTSPCFDLSVYDIFGALGAGARVVIASRALQHDPEALAAAIVDRQITIWDSAPPALAQLVAFFPTAPGEYALRCVMLSGDWIPLSLPDAVRRAFPRAEVKSLGGATEAAIWSNFFAVGPIDPRWTSVPYGRPIQNCRYHVLDVQLRPVPIGVPGDLYIGGTCLAQGYLNRSALTTERFIPDPFSIDPGARLYKTGDLARYFEDGELEFLGRSDFQVKIRGYRVELPEIEVALSALEGVREAVCSAYLDPSGQRSLVAYVLAESGATLDDSQLKAQLRARLPDYMVPPVIMFLDAWPLSANGKLDRKALPSVTQVRQNIEHVAPRTDFEQRLAQVWETVLNRRPIGLHDNFFDLGGHSLLAVMLMSELKQQLGVRVPLSLILEAPTLEAFATRCSQEPRANEDESLLVELRPGGPQCFFFVHDGDGETLLYRNLAQQLPAGYAVYGIKPLSRPSIPIAHASLIELAACYVAQVRKRQPHGPYSFAGLCAGGVIAFEMARQLHAAGEETDLLVIMDAAAPTAPVRPFLSARRRLKRTYHRVRGELFPPDRTAEPDRSQSEIRGFAPPPDDAKPLQPLHRSLSSASRKFAARAANTMRYELRWREQARSLRERFEMLRSIAQHGGDWPASVPALRAREIYEQLRDAYVPLRTPIKRPVLVKASLGEGADEAAQQLVDCDLLGWGEHIDGPIEVIDAPRGHSTMLQGGPGRLIGHHLQRLLAPDDDSLAVAPRNSVSVLVITVSYKTAALVERSLHALDRERAECPQLDLRAYVIDNASGDAPQLRAAVARHGWADWVTIAESPRNGGFAYGNNEGFRHAYREGAAPDYFLMLNPDAEIHPGAVRVLCDFLETRPDAAAAGSQLFFDDGNAWPYAFRFPSFWSEIEEGLSFGPTTRLLRNRTVRRRMGDVPEHVDWLPGASMLVRRTAIDQLGGLDERYFLYFEELDFCLKLTRAGWKCWYVPESRVTHISGQSTGVTDRSRRAAQLPAYWYQSRRRFFAKNHGLFYATSTDALSLVAHAVGRFKRQLAGKGADNIDNWFPDFVAHTVLRPRNQEVLPAIEFELEQLSEHAAPRAIRSARWAPFALNNLKRIRKRPAARS